MIKKWAMAPTEYQMKTARKFFGLLAVPRDLVCLSLTTTNTTMTTQSATMMTTAPTTTLRPQGMTTQLPTTVNPLYTGEGQ